MEDNKTKFLKGVSIQSVVTILMGILELAVFAVMSRLLTKEDFGYYAALMGIIAICTSITEAGLGSAIIQKKEAITSFVSTAFTLSWLLGALGTVLMFILAPLIATTIADEHLVIPFRIMSINIFLACIASVGKSILLRDLKFKTYGCNEVIAYISSSCLGITLALLDFGLYAIISIPVCNLILLNIILYSKSVKFPRLRIATNEVGGILSFGGWLTLSVVANQITQQLDKLFMPRWISVSALGSYNRPAGFLTTITGKLNGIFDTVLFPMLSGIQDEPNRVQHVFMRAIKLLNGVSVILFAIFFFNANLIIRLFFGEAWLDLTPILQITSIYIIFNIDNRLVDCFFRSLGLVRLGFRLRVYSAIITFIAIYLGSKFEIMGVAVGILCANIITAVLKVFALSCKINAKWKSVCVAWLVAEKPIIPFLIIGIPFLSFNNGEFWYQLLFAIIMGLIIIVEYVFYPSIVGNEYTSTIYPIVNTMKNKIIHSWKQQH